MAKGELGRGDGCEILFGWQQSGDLYLAIRDRGQRVGWCKLYAGRRILVWAFDYWFRGQFGALVWKAEPGEKIAPDVSTAQKMTEAQVDRLAMVTWIA